MTAKKEVLFIGGFNLRGDGSKGGQVRACTSLVNSRLSNRILWTLIDSTTNKARSKSIWKRSRAAWKRWQKMKELTKSKTFDGSLVFFGYGLGLLEKARMVVRFKANMGKVILCPRSGHLIDQLNKSGTARKYLSRAFSKADFILCQSLFWRNYFINQFSNIEKDKFIVQENWIQVVEVPVKYFENLNQFLFVGALDHNKGVLDAVLIIDYLVKKGLGAKLDIYGSGPLRSKLVSKITELGLEDQITLHGNQDHHVVKQAFSKAQALLFMSKVEGFPNVVLEAMGSKTLVCAYDIPMLDGIVENDVNGLSVPYAEWKQLAQRILKHSQRSTTNVRCVENAYLQVKERNTLDNVVHTLTDLLNLDHGAEV